MAFISVGDEDETPEAARKSERFRGSLPPDLETLAEAGSAGEDGVCGWVL